MTHTPFAPAQLGSITLSNHIVMAPMTRSRALGNVPNDLIVEYYRQRASAGLIITEGTAPAPAGLGYARIPGLFSQQQVAEWKRVTDAVHAEGGHIFVQLMHTGRIFHELNLPEGAEGVAPSAVAAGGLMWTDQEQMKPNSTPRALRVDELAQVRDQFVQSAKLAIEAGFDGVELHGANGYLLEQFLHPSANQRTDEYGGSVQNRARFVLEVTRAVSDAIGVGRTGIRLSPWGTHGDLVHHPEIDTMYSYLAAELQKIGVVYLHVIRQAALREAPEFAQTLRTVRSLFTNTLMVNGGFSTVAEIEQVLATGEADLVSIGVPFIANPDLVDRLQRGLPLAKPDPTTFFSPGANGFAQGFVDYPRAA